MAEGHLLQFHEDMEACVTIKQRGEHIMDDVARKIIVVQECRGQPVHLRIM